MAGIVFPNVANALLPVMQMDRQAEESRLNRERLERHDQWVMQDRAEARDLQKQQRNLQLDAAQRQKLKEASDWTTQAALGVLNSPPEHRAAAYQAALQEGKIRGFDLSNLPPAYSPGLEGMLHFYVKKAQSVNDFLKQEADRPQPMGPAGGPSAPAPSGQAPNRDQFVSMMMPHALEVSKVTGLDPRLVIAQAALETGFGASAPGNNYFGIKSHNQPGGQVLATNEAGPGGGMVPTRASFRTYGDVGASARDYADFIKTNSRYAPVLGAQGLDAQIDAMGSSGYATDPQYGAKLRAIAQTIGGPQPTTGTPPPEMVAQGANAAPMPNVSPQQVGAVPGNPAAMPQPQIAQGDAIAGQGDARTPPGAAPEVDVLRQIQLPPGAAIALRKGKPTIQDGRVEIIYPNGQLGYANLPPKKEQAGPLAGTGMDQQMMNILLTGDPASQAYAAAYAFMSKPRPIFDAATGQMTVVQPMDMSVFAAPQFGRGGQPTGPAPLPQGATQTQLPGGGTATTLPGKGKALDNSARDDLTKASGGVLELNELVGSFDPSFGGYMVGSAGDASNFAKRNLPDFLGGADPKGQAQWWQRYNQFANLERNKLFGSALTPGEKAAFESAMVNPGMKPEQITANLSRQKEIATKALSRIAKSMAAGGTNQEAIEAAIGIKLSDLPDPMGGVPQGSPPGGPADKAKQQFDLRKKYGLE